jgi:preprotein translocase subunit SecF
MEFIGKKTNFDFIGKWKLAAFVSTLLILGSIYLWLAKGDAKFGVDFRGGHEIVVRLPGASSEGIRKALDEKGIKEAIVQSFEVGKDEFSIRLGGEGAEEQQDATRKVKDGVLSTLSGAFPGATIEVLKTDYVGPTVGEELRMKALWATIAGLVFILGYLTFRFEFAFGLGAVVAVFHDVIVSLGFYLLAGYTINMGTIAAALTILGYSVHDTIVVFDRVREEINHRKHFVLSELLNDCINATLSRTLITTMLTIFSVAALLVFGGGTISDLSFFLLVGLISGTYSTIWIAAPIVLAWENFRRPLARSAEARGA